MKVKVEGYKELMKRLERLKVEQPGQRFNVLVTYNTPYAIYVHENLTARHPVGQAKYLEAPTRLYERRMAAMIVDLMKQGKSQDDAVLKAAHFLLQQSRPFVPKDTWALVDSGRVVFVPDNQSEGSK